MKIIQTLFHTISQIPNKLTWLDSVSDWLQPIIHRIYQSGGVGQKIENFLNGTWLGHPFHPVMTDIPIGAWTAAVTLDTLESSTRDRRFAKGADAAVAVGVAGAVGAAVSGLTDWQHLRGESRRTGILHALLNTIGLGLFLGSLGARASRNRSLGRGLALTGYGIMGISAFLGGDLVYRQRIGVKHAPAVDDGRDYMPVLAESSLPQNVPTRVELDGTRILLVRRGDQVYAIQEVCSHLGGPLAEGELWPDDSIVCPWHGSRFDLHTGRVIDGPSAYNQAAFDARIFNGRVELRKTRKESSKVTGRAPAPEQPVPQSAGMD
jgi:nitrite reductase/ring-hydroxylating ferredoxin subunit/uncharacterized membrane protein